MIDRKDIDEVIFLLDKLGCGDLYDETAVNDEDRGYLTVGDVTDKAIALLDRLPTYEDYKFLEEALHDAETELYKWKTRCEAAEKDIEWALRKNICCCCNLCAYYDTDECPDFSCNPKWRGPKDKEDSND